MARLETSLEYADGEYRKPIRGNMAIAYSNWAAGYQNQGNRPKARSLLRLCLEKVPEAGICRTRMQDL